MKKRAAMENAHRTDGEKTLKLKRKRQEKDLDSIHAKILKLNEMPDNEKNVGDDRRCQARAKICKRLLPKLATGIYKNGAKSKDIRKAELTNDEEARRQADALTLLEGCLESECVIEEVKLEDIAEESSSKDVYEEGTQHEESPVLGKRENENSKQPIGESQIATVGASCSRWTESDWDNLKNLKIVRRLDLDGGECSAIPQEDVREQRLLPKDEDHLEQSYVIAQCSNTANDRVGERDLRQTLLFYLTFCQIVDELFKRKQGNILLEILDPLKKAISELRRYCVQHLLEMSPKNTNNQASSNMESMACQASTSNASQLSPTKAECSEPDLTIAPKIEEPSRNDHEFRSTRNNEFRRDSVIFRSWLARSPLEDPLATLNTTVPNIDYSDNEVIQRLRNIHQLPKPVNQDLVNENEPGYLNARSGCLRESNYTPSPTREHTSNIYSDISSASLNNSENVNVDTDAAITHYIPPVKDWSKLSLLSKLSELSWKDIRKRFPDCVNALSQEHYEQTAARSARPESVIHYPYYSNVIADSYPAQTSEVQHIESLHKKPTIHNNFIENFNGNFYQAENQSNPNRCNISYAMNAPCNQPNRCNTLTSNVMNVPCNQSNRCNTLTPNVINMPCNQPTQSESYVELMRTQENFEIDPRAHEHDEREDFHRVDRSSCQLWNTESSLRTNTYVAEPPAEPQEASCSYIGSHANRYPPINNKAIDLSRKSYDNFDLQLTEQRLPVQSMSHSYNTNTAKQDLLFDDGATATLSSAQNARMKKRVKEEEQEEIQNEEMFGAASSSNPPENAYYEDENQPSTSYDPRAQYQLETQYETLPSTSYDPRVQYQPETPYAHYEDKNQPSTSYDPRAQYQPATLYSYYKDKNQPSTSYDPRDQYQPETPYAHYEDKNQPSTSYDPRAQYQPETPYAHYEDKNQPSTSYDPRAQYQPATPYSYYKGKNQPSTSYDPRAHYQPLSTETQYENLPSTSYGTRATMSQFEPSYRMESYDDSTYNLVNLPSGTASASLLYSQHSEQPIDRKPDMIQQHSSRPIKYACVKKDSAIQKKPVFFVKPYNPSSYYNLPHKALPPRKRYSTDNPWTDAQRE